VGRSLAAATGDDRRGCRTGGAARHNPRLAITPDRLLGRVHGTMRFIVWGSRPIGFLLGGYLGSRIGLPATLVVGAFGMLIAFVPLMASPIPRLRLFSVE
jgi:hypothetical protein